MGALAGVPLALKDVLAMQGQPTTCGSKMLEGWRPPYNATVVEKLHAADIVILGKTNMDEFAMGSSTEHSAYGPTRNPWDLERIPGGSGGGSHPWNGPKTGGSATQGSVTGVTGISLYGSAGASAAGASSVTASTAGASSAGASAAGASSTGFSTLAAFGRSTGFFFVSALNSSFASGA